MYIIFVYESIKGILDFKIDRNIKSMKKVNKQTNSNIPNCRGIEEK